MLALLWAFLAGPLAGNNGHLVVNSDPPGATVTVNGNNLGVTPLKAQVLPPGTYKIVLAKPMYAPVTRQMQISAGSMDRVNATLTLLPASDLLGVHDATVTTDLHIDSGKITVGPAVSQVKVGQEVAMAVNLVQKYPGSRALNFQWQMALFDKDNNQVLASQPAQGTIQKSDQIKGFFFTFHFNANPDGTAPAGNYQLKFLVDGNELVSRPIELLP
jgi:hypothetical protein